jgi:hypothetical protein
MTYPPERNPLIRQRGGRIMPTPVHQYGEEIVYVLALKYSRKGIQTTLNLLK